MPSLLETSYKASDIIRIITPDTTLIHIKSLLMKRLALFEDYFEDNPESHEILLDLPSRKLQLTFAYLDDGFLPNSIEDWLDLLKTADYLGIKPSYEVMLTEDSLESYFYYHNEITKGQTIRYYDFVGSSLPEIIDSFTRLLQSKPATSKE